MANRIGFGLVVLVALAGCAASGPSGGSSEDQGSSTEAVCPGGGTIEGIDVSYYQGNVDWPKAKQGGIDFAFARIADGAGYVDSKFATNWAGMKAAGVVRGSYQFFRPTQDASAQAKVVVDHLASAGGLDAADIAPALDIEVTDGASSATIKSKMLVWLEAVQSATGRTPIIYTSPGFWVGLGDTSAFAPYTLWIANWGVGCPHLPANGSWQTFQFWQYTDSGAVAGVSGSVDRDRWNGSLADLQAFLGGNASSSSSSSSSTSSGGGSQCPNDGLYCGGDVIGGDSGTLYQCSSHALSVAQVCANGCSMQPAGQNDFCASAPPPPTCPNDGYYCGGDVIAGDPGTLYQCSSHVLSTAEVCGNGCSVQPAGYDDYCF